MNTCVSMGCPFILVCKEYNFLVDRGEKCETQENILRQAKKLEKQRSREAEKKSGKIEEKSGRIM